MAERKWELTPEEMGAALEVGAKRYLAAYEAAYQKHKAGEVVLYPSEFHIKAGAIANAAVKKFIDYINSHSSDEAQAWGSPAYRKGTALPVWKKVEQEVGL